MSKKIYKERHLERRLCAEMEQRGGMAIKLHGAVMAGLPDRLLLCRGRACFAEVKTTGKHPTPLQRWMHGRLLAMGFATYIVDDMETLNNAIAHATR